MTLPPGYRWRPARDADAGAVAAIANEEAEAFIGAPIWSSDWLLRNWTAPSTDRERDIAVVEAPDGAVCGYLGVGADPPFAEVFAIGIVATSHQGRGLGAAIVAEGERRAGRFLDLADPSRRVVVHAGTLADEPRASSLFEAAGYAEVRRFSLMRADFAAEPAPPPAVPGIGVRTLRRDADGRRVYEAHREAFGDHWGSGEETYEDFRHHVLAGPLFDAELCFVAWAGPQVAGYLTAIRESEEDPSRGYVQTLGVRRDYRRRGVGESLLRHAFRALYARGKEGCDLHVDTQSETGATRLYERVGMVSHPRFATWEKVLRPGG